MQDDVADAPAWVVKRGDADPQRVCIAGASCGAYAALMGLVRPAELCRCVAAWVAVTDPLLLYSGHSNGNVSAEFRHYGLPQRVGDAVKDAAKRDALSPVLQAERLRAPRLLAFGAENRRVPLVHGTRLRERPCAPQAVNPRSRFTWTKATAGRIWRTRSTSPAGLSAFWHSTCVEKLTLLLLAGSLECRAPSVWALYLCF